MLTKMTLRGSHHQRLQDAGLHLPPRELGGLHGGPCEEVIEIAQVLFERILHGFHHFGVLLLEIQELRVAVEPSVAFLFLFPGDAIRSLALGYQRAPLMLGFTRVLLLSFEELADVADVDGGARETILPFGQALKDFAVAGEIISFAGQVLTMIRNTYFACSHPHLTRLWNLYAPFYHTIC